MKNVKNESGKGGNKAFDISDKVNYLVNLHYSIKTLLDNKDFSKLKLFLRIYDNEITDPNVLKTILVITKAFKDSPIKAERLAIKQRLESIVGTQ